MTALHIRDARIASASFRPRTEAVDTLVLHHTALDLAASLKVLREGAVSVHFVLAEDGTAYKLLEDGEVGWHAGLSMWRGRPDVNARSIGIEIVNLDGNLHAYPRAQVAALIELCTLILRRHPGIGPRNVVGHSDIAPRRKVDPGRRFPWQRLAEAGIGRWPGGAEPRPVGSEAEVQVLLEACGYPPPHAFGRDERRGGNIWVPDAARPPPGVTGVERVTTADILRAFQLHYQPRARAGRATAHTMGLLHCLAAP
ncbi:MAG: N-acetylmuramoyl-L-alanine amidase [Rubrivivax sp.]|nr:N-acetylmuramoyl-L-alanine amidase [Rubrivivax sp.]